MSIATNSIITYSDITPIVLNSLKSVCCNIDTISSDVPPRLTSSSVVEVGSVTTTVSPGGQAQTFRWYAHPSDLITVVTSSTVESEWSSFLSQAQINSRSNKVLKATDLGEIMGLFMEFMSCHVKSIYSKREIYNNVDGVQDIYQGCKYITGSFPPSYTRSGFDPSNIPVTTNSDIQTVIQKNFNADKLMTHNNDPRNYRSYLSNNS